MLIVFGVVVGAMICANRAWNSLKTDVRYDEPPRLAEGSGPVTRLEFDTEAPTIPVIYLPSSDPSVVNARRRGQA